MMIKGVKDGISINIKKKSVIIDHLEIDDSNVYEFLKDSKNKEDLLKKTIIIGCTALKGIDITQKMDYVEKQFNKLLQDIDDHFKNERELISKKIDETFDLKNNDSPIAKLYNNIEKTFDETNKKSPMGKLTIKLEDYFDDKKGTVQALMHKTFDTKNKESPIYKLIENLDEYFGNNGKVNTMLDNSFSLDNRKSMLSKFADILSENFDVDKGKIKKLLDSSKKDSPMYELKESLSIQLREILTKLQTKKALEEQAERTPLKGGDFEAIVEELLNKIAQPYGDIIENVGFKPGKTGKNGDFIADIEGNPKLRIVIEAKNSESYNCKKTDNEIQEAIKNRDAKFGIFLFKTENLIPEEYRPVKITHNTVITSAENHGLYFAYRLARIFLEEEAHKKKGELPLENIQKAIEDAIGHAKDLENIRKKADNIIGAGEYIKETIEKTHNRILEKLQEIQDDLK